MRVSVTSAGACAIAGRPMRTLAHKPSASRIVAFSMVSSPPRVEGCLGATRLVLLRGPAIRVGAGAPHQHGAFTGAQALGLAEGLDGLFVVEDGEGASPVGPPEATFEPPGVEDASERVPDVRERVGFPGQRAGTADLDHRVPALGEVEHLGQIGPGLGWGGRRSGLHDGQMVDDESRVGVAVDERRARVHVAPAQHVDRKVVPNRCAQDPVEARVARIASRLLRHHDPDADRARRSLPVGDDVGDGRIIWIDRLDEGEPAGMSPLHFHRIARVVAGHGKGGDEDRAVDADRVHRGHQPVTRDGIGPVRASVPGPFRGVRLVDVNLGIDGGHRNVPPCQSFIASIHIGRAVWRIAGAAGRGNVIDNVEIAFAAWSAVQRSRRAECSMHHEGGRSVMTVRLESVTFTSGDGETRVPSYLAARDRDGPHPVVLILRGVAGPDDGYTEIARRLAEWGYVALVHGWKVRGADPTDEPVYADLQGAMSFLGSVGPADLKRLAVFGFCRGGVHALMAARAHAEIRVIVVFHGFAFRPAGAQPGAEPYDLSRGVNVPMLVLHGTEDERAPMSDMRRMEARMRAPGKGSRLVFYDGARHR